MKNLKEKRTNSGPNTRVPRLFGVPPMELLQCLFCRAYQALSRLPGCFLRWITFPKHQILHTLPSLIFPAFANRFHHIVRFPFDLDRRGWRLVTALDGRLTVGLQLRHMENRVVQCQRGRLNFEGSLAHCQCLQHFDQSQAPVVQLLGGPSRCHVLHADHYHIP